MQNIRKDFGKVLIRHCSVEIAKNVPARLSVNLVGINSVIKAVVCDDREKKC